MVSVWVSYFCHGFELLWFERFHFAVDSYWLFAFGKPSTAKLQLSSAGDSGRTQCKLLEYDVGLKCLAALLGVGQARLRRSIACTPDLRFGKRQHHSRAGTWTVDSFLQVAYDSIAETLPDQYFVQKLICWILFWKLWIYGSFYINIPKVNIFQTIIPENPRLRFVHRGRASRPKPVLDDDAPSDFEELASDLENEEELKGWLSSVHLKSRGLIPGETLVRKLLPPWTVMDLYEHYKATQSLLGGHCVSSLGSCLSFFCVDVPPQVLLKNINCGEFVFPWGTGGIKVWDIQWCLQTSLVRCLAISSAQPFHYLWSMFCIERPTEWQESFHGTKVGFIEAVQKSSSCTVLWSYNHLAVAIRVSRSYHWYLGHFNWWIRPK